MKALPLLLILVTLFVPAAAQNVKQDDSLIITCKSDIPAARYFCWEYDSKQKAAWATRPKQSGDNATLTLGFKQFAKNKVVVDITTTSGGVRNSMTFTVKIDSGHLKGAANVVVDAVTATLNQWAKK